MRPAAAVCGLLGLLAWAGPGGASEDEAAAAADALSGLEARLAAAPAVVFGFEVTSTGAFASALAGEARLDPDRIRLQATGSFGGEPVDLSLAQHDGRLTGGRGESRFDEPAPAATRQAILVGWIRMGILHNLALLSAVRPPDRAGGGVGEWVTLHAPRRPAGTSPDDRAATGLEFDIRVSGQDSGRATLWLDAQGLPVARQQTVRFPGGEMQVLERYTDVRADLPNP